MKGCKHPNAARCHGIPDETRGFSDLVDHFTRPSSDRNSGSKIGQEAKDLKGSGQPSPKFTKGVTKYQAQWRRTFGAEVTTKVKIGKNRGLTNLSMTRLTVFRRRFQIGPVWTPVSVVAGPDRQYWP